MKTNNNMKNVFNFSSRNDVLRGLMQRLCLMCLIFVWCGYITLHAESEGKAVEKSDKQVSQQQKELLLRGLVTDKDGTSLPGVAVQVKGTSQGTTTNADGEYYIMVKGVEAPVLVFSFVGMETLEVPYQKGRHRINVTLQESQQVMEEVVVTGYQAMSRRELASAITTVKASDVITPEAMSIDQMLQGKIPGMAVMTQSGEPSSTPTIRIRCNSTINGNKAPIWVVDGVIMADIVPFSASDLNSPDAAYLIGNSISGLSPQDIESISVLKDASATAIYGVKDANGVIFVTSKKGQVSAPLVT